MADYFNFGSRRQGDSVNQDRLNAPLPPGPGSRPRPSYMGSYENMRNPSSIRIRRLPSYVAESSRPTTSQHLPTPRLEDQDDDEEETTGRRRSMSAPHRFGAAGLAPPATDLSRQRTVDDPMQTITEDTPSTRQHSSSVHPGYHEAVETPQLYNTRTTEQFPAFDGTGVMTPGTSHTLHSTAHAAQRNRGLGRSRGDTASSRYSGGQRSQNDDHYDSDVVDFLDLIGALI